jgi:hypothetical protein
MLYYNLFIIINLIIYLLQGHVLKAWLPSDGILGSDLVTRAQISSVD